MDMKPYPKKYEIVFKTCRIGLLCNLYPVNRKQEVEDLYKLSLSVFDLMPHSYRVKDSWPISVKTSSNPRHELQTNWFGIWCGYKS